MTELELQDLYQKKADHFSVTLKSVEKTINVVSNTRLAVALLFLALLYFGFKMHVLLNTLPLLLLIFIILVRTHSKFFDQKVHLENLIKVQLNELKGLGGDQSSFDSGSPFIDTHHAYTHDLDIFGEGSLFQFVNRCNTLSGKKLLAERFNKPFDTIGQITTHQQAVQEVATKTDFRHEVQATGMEVEELPGDRQQLKEWVSSKPFIYGSNFYRIVLILFPALTLLLLIGSFVFENVSPFFWLCALLQLAFLGFHFKKVNAFHEFISRKRNVLNKYAKLLRKLSAEEFSSSLMIELKSKANNADVKVKKLASLVGGLDARLNSMTSLVVNGLLLYDLQYVYRLEKWKVENALQLDEWLSTIQELEVLCSFGTLSFNNPEFQYPAINGDRRLVAVGLGHPLIFKNERVTNDIRLSADESILIITGANMAGKSTFLRTLGVNVVLALAGAPVCAEKFDCPLIEIRSGMRTADSLKDNQSYFYAELNRLKSIVDELKLGKHLLILLDEILKGTNSTDKQAGSIALVKQLIDHPSLVLIATHDLALGELENQYPQRIRNFCFEPFISDDQLSFDYKLKPGLAVKMNATFLMKKMGIIPA
jgi:DNA mismatch repair ATPase MutS